MAEPLFQKAKLLDKSRSADPTNTLGIRQAWRATAQMRLRQLRGQLRIAVIEHDVLALGGSDRTSIMLYHPVAVRLNAFGEWLNYASSHTLVSDWSSSYVAKAWQSGLIAAHKQAVVSIGSEATDHEAMIVKVNQELRGISAALVQQVSREADKVLRKSRIQAWRQLR